MRIPFLQSSHARRAAPRQVVPRPKSAPAWALVLCGGLIMGLALGVRHVQGLFLLPVVTERGWTRETFAFAMAIQNLSWGLSQPLTGMVADRFGPARVIAAGLVLYALGLAGMASTTSPALFVASAGVCIGIALSCTAFGAVYGSLNRLVEPERRGWALGLAGAIGGFGQFAMVPSAQLLLRHQGWIATLGLLAIVMAALLPLARVLRAPAHVASASSVTSVPGAAIPDQTLTAAIGEALRHRGFWLLNLGFLACGFQLAFIATHLPAYLLDKGLRATDAVAALALVALTNTFGTYVFGLLGARRRRKYLLSGIYLVRIAAMALFILLPLTPASLYVFAAVMGFVWLGTVPLTNGLVSQVFGVRYINTLFGFVFFGHQLGGFLGVWLGGVVYVHTHSYDLIWLVAMVLGVLAAALHWPIDDRAVARAPAPGATLAAA